MSWLVAARDVLWHSALAAVPLALLAAAACRLLTLRPATRHGLWLMVLAWFIAAPLLPSPRLIDVWSPPQPVPAESALPAHGSGGASPRAAMITDASPPQFLVRRQPSPVIDASILRSQPPDHPATATTRKAFGDSPAAQPMNAPRPSNQRSVDVHIAPLDEREINHSGSPVGATGGLSASVSAERGALAVQLPAAPSAFQSTPAMVRRTESADANQQPVQQTIRPVETPRTVGSELRPSALPWLSRLADLRAAAAGIPALPAPIWLAGIAVILFWQAWSRWCFLLLLRGALPAPTAIVRQVSAAAGRLRLGQVPEVVLVRVRVSPMIWWRGLQRAPQLILPLPLWLELDAVGRNAVLFHELAHLRRRDHWVRLVGAVLGGVYWWNPMMWWIRSRIDDEAESCCDGWVTWLLPRGRRAYAEALLRTRQFISKTGSVMPATGIGVMTRRAKRFARRLTMVMTDASTPRLSGWGWGTIAVLAVAGWVLRTAVACPPEHDHAVAQHAKAPAAPAAPRPPSAPCARTPAPPCSPTAPRASWQLAPLSDGPPRFFGTAAEAPPAAPGAPGGEPDWDTYALHIEARHSAELEARVARLEDQVARISGAPVVAQPLPGAYAAVIELAMIAPGEDGELVWRFYRLPEGKLEALTALMVRNDVPVLVQAQDDHIAVQATPAQHAVFAAFCQMIHPEFEVSMGDDPSAAAELMQAALADQEANRAEFAVRNAEVTARTAEMHVRMQQLSSEAQALQARVSALEMESEQLAGQADTLEAQAEWVEKLSQTMTGQAQREALQKAAELTRQAKALETQARQLEHQAEVLSERVVELDDRATEVEEAAQEMHESQSGLRTE